MKEKKEEVEKLLNKLYAIEEYRCKPIILDNNNVIVYDVSILFKHSKRRIVEYIFIWDTIKFYKERKICSRYYEAEHKCLMNKLSKQDMDSIYKTIKNSYDSIIFQLNL